MRKPLLGIALGSVAGIIDLIPMILQGLTWDANLSAFFMWVVSGFFISSTSLKANAAVKGVLISLLVLLPCAFLIAWKEPVSLVPILAITLVLGSLLGYSIERFGR